ncbi:protein of unknown function YGGT [Alkaliphilus metalliredigens QYMF]|uniref:YggT family protein n=1 Tax=Alkaliphilus metalliredigens (strain QYMF) TaxID=293826 RepID=A6TRY4_ALKMQ|nr:YggT family protein [Alkaliphilus metalliredigens]ABR48952.1 protein of unknown function YGGT [Alkaliphilus metalliredigens QYMF]
MFANAVIVEALDYLARIMNILILIRVLFTWINPNPHSTFVRLVNSVTEPILVPVRHLIYNVFGYSGMLDFSPILAIFLINIINSALVRLVFIMG